MPAQHNARPIACFFAVSGSTLFVCMGAAGAYVVFNRGFGAGDLRALLFWGLPFSLAVGGLGTRLNWIFAKPLLPLRILRALLLGASAGLLYTLFLALLMGPWIHAFSFPILSIFMAAAISGLLIAIAIRAQVTRGAILLLAALIGGVSVGSVVLPGPLFRFIVNEQEFLLIFVRWRPAPGPLIVEESQFFSGDSLTSTEIERLRALGVSGTLRVVSSHQQGKGKPSRAVIVMSRQVDRTVELFQPDASHVIYLQGEKGWTMSPPTAPVLTRKVILAISPLSERQTQYWVEVPAGRSGGLAFEW